MNKIKRDDNGSQFSIRVDRFIKRLQGSTMTYDLAPYRKITDCIDRHGLSICPDARLKELAGDLRDRARAGTPLDDLLVESYALVREASVRTLGLCPFDVQIMAGIALHRGKLAQVQTGEGKTLAAVFPAFLNGLSGKGVHVLTANDYLAERDAGWMGPIYQFLGLKAAFVREGMTARQRQEAYRADITYLTAKEAGFDFLRDRLCYEKDHLVQRPFNYAIVDEADFIMIDEARVPLVIAGQAPDPETDPKRMAEIAAQLIPGTDYLADEDLRSVSLTAHGLDRVESILGCGSLHDPENRLLFASINVALHARALLQRDRDYIVRGEKIELVDEFTGRVADRRRWPHGIQPALEAREGVPIQPEGCIYGSITLQHYLHLYPKLAGMTATAVPAADEFKGFYNLDIVVIPPNKPCIRIDHDDIVFADRAAKERAVIEEIVRVHKTGRPILVGTASVAESETLADSLKNRGVSCRVLNARNDAFEAKIVAEAGAPAALTISTNMAGRGTDIRLGGENEESRDQVAALGGLYVIGTNRHESRRIDDQLRGRAGRQGDPGASRFFISLEDDLMQRYGIHGLIPEKYFSANGGPIEDPFVGREIARCQRIIEGQNYEIRHTLHGYAQIVELQRRRVQQRREQVLLGTAPSLLEEQAGQRFRELRAKFGTEVLSQVEKEISLYVIDRCWGDYLAHVTDIREGIHLLRLGGKAPLVEFQFTMAEAFADVQERIEKEIIETFHAVKVDENGIDAGDKAGLRGPSSTWTYLINDNPFSNLGIDLTAARNIGAASAAGILAAAYWPITLVLLLARFLGKFFKGKKAAKML